MNMPELKDDALFDVSLEMHGRYGYINVSDGIRSLQMYAEISAVEEYDLLVTEVENWHQPCSQLLSPPELRRLDESLKAWMEKSGCRCLFYISPTPRARRFM
jgi:hypothetical protein